MEESNKGPGLSDGFDREDDKREYDERGRREYEGRGGARSLSPPRGGFSPSNRRSELGHDERNEQHEESLEPKKVLGIFGLAPQTHDGIIRPLFERFGKVDDVSIIVDKSTGKSKCYGFIYMANVEDAIAAYENLNKSKIDGKEIRVDFSVTDGPHNPTPGQYMGKRTLMNRKYSGYRPYERQEYNKYGRTMPYSHRPPKHGEYCGPYYDGGVRDYRKRQFYDEGRSGSRSPMRYNRTYPRRYERSKSPQYYREKDYDRGMGRMSGYVPRQGGEYRPPYYMQKMDRNKYEYSGIRNRHAPYPPSGSNVGMYSPQRHPEYDRYESNINRTANHGSDHYAKPYRNRSR